jgi:N-acetylmuramoyl-L-alanine amidase
VPDFKIETAASPNYSKGRRGRKILAIVNHITAGLMPGTLTWMQNPAVKVSAHFLVTKSGRIYQLVNEEDTAFSVGIVNKPDWDLYDGTNPNYYTLNIEHEALAGEQLTDIQYEATLWLHEYLISKWNIPIDKDHIIGHYRLDSINRRNDPGNFPWERLLSDLNNHLNHEPTITILVDNQPVAGLMLENRAYAAVRELGYALGMEVLWDAAGRNIFVYSSKSDPSSTADGVNIFLCQDGLKGIIQKDTAYTLVQEIAEILGKKVTWNDETKSVIITS